MTNRMFRVALVAVAISVFAASAVFAAEANAPAAPKPPVPAPMVVRGTVSVVKDANSVVPIVRLAVAADKVVYSIIPDKEGLKLGNEANGKEVVVQAIRNGISLKVLSFKVVEKAAEKPKGKPNPKPK